MLTLFLCTTNICQSKCPRDQPGIDSLFQNAVFRSGTGTLQHECRLDARPLATKEQVTSQVLTDLYTLTVPCGGGAIHIHLFLQTLCSGFKSAVSLERKSETLPPV